MTIPHLETERLVLEPFGSAEHIQAWCEMDMDAEVMRHIRPPSPDLEFARKRLQDAETGGPAIVGNWGIREKAGNTIVGRGLLRWLADESAVEIGYRLSRASWGKGYATELALAIVDYSFATLSLPAICGVYQQGNIGSRKVLEKCGMVDAGTTSTHGNSAKPMMMITRDQWLADKA
ncbi:GNAT family N-acetyltransferase [Thalassospira marina]|uniref:GNAT family N-acetyltransferase n=1 Tax=Thalassospira marina TaxID=2048283 RepID=A0ABN5FH90_9PROT|nr:GNAT family N-acetyltransferase [Thalassospira marina]AUG53565.1 GNAT family N-acetyltransferase [Thalassospira marina]